jgi:hypothetical protein
MELGRRAAGTMISVVEKTIVPGAFSFNNPE